MQLVLHYDTIIMAKIFSALITLHFAFAVKQNYLRHIIEGPGIRAPVCSCIAPSSAQTAPVCSCYHPHHNVSEDQMRCIPACQASCVQSCVDLQQTLPACQVACDSTCFNSCKVATADRTPIIPHSVENSRQNQLTSQQIFATAAQQKPTLQQLIMMEKQNSGFLSGEAPLEYILNPAKKQEIERLIKSKTVQYSTRVPENALPISNKVGQANHLARFYTFAASQQGSFCNDICIQQCPETSEQNSCQDFCSAQCSPGSPVVTTNANDPQNLLLSPTSYTAVPETVTNSPQYQQPAYITQGSSIQMQQPAVVTQVEQVLSPYTMQSHIDNMNVAANSITPNIQNEIGMSQNVAVNETELKPIIFVDTAPLTETDYEQLFPLIKEKGSNIICIDICLPYCADQCVTLRTANNSSTLQGQSGSIPEPQLPTQSVTRELQSWQQQRLQMGGSQNQQMQDEVQHALNLLQPVQKEQEQYQITQQNPIRVNLAQQPLTDYHQVQKPSAIMQPASNSKNQYQEIQQPVFVQGIQQDLAAVQPPNEAHNMLQQIQQTAVLPQPSQQNDLSPQQMQQVVISGKQPEQTIYQQIQPTVPPQPLQQVYNSNQQMQQVPNPTIYVQAKQQVQDQYQQITPTLNTVQPGQQVGSRYQQVEQLATPLQSSVQSVTQTEISRQQQLIEPPTVLRRNETNLVFGSSSQENAPAISIVVCIVICMPACTAECLQKADSTSLNNFSSAPSVQSALEPSYMPLIEMRVQPDPSTAPSSPQQWIPNLEMFQQPPQQNENTGQTQNFQMQAPDQQVLQGGLRLINQSSEVQQQQYQKQYQIQQEQGTLVQNYQNLPESQPNFSMTPVNTRNNNVIIDQQFSPVNNNCAQQCGNTCQQHCVSENADPTTCNNACSVSCARICRSVQSHKREQSDLRYRLESTDVIQKLVHSVLQNSTWTNKPCIARHVDESDCLCPGILMCSVRSG
ncbi:unnamed protein product [Enterobius vermicularis]|uniref:Protein muscleblind n=1 Tax=Enterobius vermicularis TaxID=51028 RepID=A0A0N4VJG8_ENTVE|nr:unnamed protein product [Enterobius vermicularis]